MANKWKDRLLQDTYTRSVQQTKQEKGDKRSDYDKYRTQAYVEMMKDEKLNQQKLSGMGLTGGAAREQQKALKDYQAGQLDQINQMNPDLWPQKADPVKPVSIPGAGGKKASSEQNRVPLRSYVNDLGGQVRWNEDTNTAYVSLGDKKDVPFWVGDSAKTTLGKDDRLQVPEGKIRDALGIESVQKYSQDDIGVRDVGTAEDPVYEISAGGRTMRLRRGEIASIGPQKLAGLIWEYTGVDYQAAATFAQAAYEGVLEDNLPSGDYQMVTNRVQGDGYDFLVNTVRMPDGRVKTQI